VASNWIEPLQGDQMIEKMFTQFFCKVAKTVAKAKKAKYLHQISI
jgi:hypothetical protein